MLSGLLNRCNTLGTDPEQMERKDSRSILLHSQNSFEPHLHLKVKLVGHHGGAEEASGSEGGGQHEGGDAADQGGEGDHPLGPQERRHQDNQVPPLPQGSL